MQEHIDTLTKLLHQAKTEGTDAADAVLFSTTDVSQSQRLGKLEGLERAESKAVGLRAFIGGRQAIASSTDLSASALAELAARAVAMAKAAPEDPDSTLAPLALHPASIPDLELEDGEEPPLSWLSEQIAAAEDAALSVKGVTNSEGAEAQYGKTHVCLGILAGKGIAFAQGYSSSHFSVSVSVVAGEGTAMERDYDFTSARHRSDLAAASAVGKSAGERAVKRLHARKVSTCKAPVMFDPRISKSLVGMLAGAASGNAVARGASFLKDSMGKRIFPKSISIIDDPLRARGLASKPFDGEGVKTERRALVQNGALKSWLLDMRTANKLKLETTGHASRGVSSPPSPSATNLYMENGEETPEALMKAMKSGLYVTETFGMGVNLITGDYSQGASGFWIEDGAIAYPVSEITIAGRLQDMFANLIPANDLEFRYATNAPTILIQSMTVAGA